MANEQLLNFIRQSRQTGTPDDQIHQSLVSSGWQMQDIQEAFNSLNSQLLESTVSLSAPGKKHLKLIIVIAIVTVLIGAYFVSAKYFFHTWPFKNLELVISPSPSQTVATQSSLTESVVKKIENGSNGSCTFSSNFEHIACAENSNCLFDPKLQQEMCTRGKDNKGRYVVDGQPGEWYQDFFYGNFVFSPSGQRFAYKIKRGDKQLLILDGKEGKLYDSIGDFRFTPDGSKFIYTAYKGKNQVVVINGEESKEYNEIASSPVFSPDSKRIAYGVRQLKSYYVVVDGQEGKSHSYIPTNIGFSPDSSQLVYIAQDIAGDNGRSYGLNRTLVLNGKESNLPIGNSYNIFPTFSPDSKHLVYQAERNKKLFVVLDGKEGKPYDWIIDTVFSPDSKRLAYVAGRDKKQFVVVDGVEDKLIFDEVGSPVFSPDSQRVAYRARRGDEEGGKMITVVDGQERKAYDYHSVGGGSLSQLKPVFSPDSKHVAYISWVNQEEVVVVDDKDGKQYDSIQSKTFNYLQFSPDSQKIVYVAATYPKQYSAGGKGQVFTVINDNEGESYEDIKIISLKFNQANNSVSYVAKKGNDYYRVEQPL